MNIKDSLKSFNKVAEDSDGRIILFGIVMFINFPLFHFLFQYNGSFFYANISLRLLASFLCIPLILKNYWPSRLKPYLLLYWYGVILYCLPFFFTFMSLKNHLSAVWLMNTVSATFFMLLLLDIFIFFIIFILGLTIGCFAFLIIGDVFYIDLGSIDTLGLLSTYGAAIIIGSMFAYNNSLMEKEKIHTMKMLAGSIAHELRTPLSAMMMSGQALGRILPTFQAGYNEAKAANLLEQTVDSDQETYLAGLPQNLQTASRNAHIMITILLTNLNEGTADRKLESCSMTLCVDEALKAYPFSPSERGLVHWRNGEGTQNDVQADFTFLGHKELMKHVLFNLFKNSLYAIASTGKGEIIITVEPAENSTGKKTNQLIFKDTGPGIPPENLRHIFDRFYTKTEHGTGIGLAFCQSVIQGFGGEITCTSRQGEHTTFTVSFPVK